MKSTPNQPKVAIVIVNWNKKEYILNLLESLNQIDYKNCDTIVVDNASTDGSEQAICEKFPHAELIVNSENLGGTGGFNTGMSYALSKDVYKYIWLLDNDVQVESNTLSELVKVMEDDQEVGIAGSMTLIPDKPHIVNNAGLKIDWNSGLLKPLFGNEPISEVEDGVYQVDCIPACSALGRSETLNETTLMDERYFIWWDDIDLCLQIGAMDKKVVSVTSSKIFHPSDKRRVLLNYYNYRNVLLIYSKYTGFTKRLSIYHRIASSLSKLILFSYLINNRYLSKILYLSYRDFFLNRWGKLNEHGLETRKPPELSDSTDIEYGAKIMVLPNGTVEKISKTIESLRDKNPVAHISLLIQNHRKNLFESLPVDDFIVYNEKRRFSLPENTRLFIGLLIKNFDMAILPGDQEVSPFGCTAKKLHVYLEDENILKLKGVRGDMWKVLSATVLGELIALPLTAGLLIKSFQYNKEKNRTV